MILEFWSVASIEIISPLEKEFTDEYAFKKSGTPISEVSTQQFRITPADLPNSKHVVSQIQTNNLSVAKKMTNVDTIAILVVINHHLFWVLIKFILYILGKKSFTSLRIPYIATMVAVAG